MEHVLMLGLSADRVSIVLGDANGRLSIVVDVIGHHHGVVLLLLVISAACASAGGVVDVDLGEKGHGVDGTGRPIKTSAKRPHKSPPVFVAEGAVEQEITGGVDRDEAIENIAQGPENGLFVRLRFRFVKDFVDEGGGRRQLADQEHDDDSDQSHRDADLVGGGPFLAVARSADCLTLGHYLTKFLTLTHRLDQERVKDDEQRQRQQHLPTPIHQLQFNQLCTVLLIIFHENIDYKERIKSINTKEMLVNQ